MDKALVITFKTTHQTMKAQKLLKPDFRCEVIPAPKELLQAGCKIALYVPDTLKKETLLEILRSNNLSVSKLIETDRIIVN